jgi:hypothetical protein
MTEPVTKKARRSKVKYRVSGFNPAWKKDFTWLESATVDGKTGMRCKLCTNTGNHLGTGRAVGQSTLAFLYEETK